MFKANLVQVGSAIVCSALMLASVAAQGVTLRVGPALGNGGTAPVELASRDE